MWSFAGKKEDKCWIWIAHDRVRKTVVAFQLGTRGYKTGKKLWNKVKDLKVNLYASDHWHVYPKLFPENKHIIGKEHTQNIEGFNSNFRLFLKRLNRKTKCYSKTEEMLEASLRLVIHKFNLIYGC